MLWLLLLGCALPFSQAATLSKDDLLSLIPNDSKEIYAEEMTAYIKELAEEYFKAPTAKSELEAMRENIYETLQRESQRVVPANPKIDWVGCNVIGWPSDVLFYTKKFWDLKDCESLQRVKHQIRFEVKKRTTRSVPRHVKEGLKAEINELSTKLFGGSTINWRGIKKLCPTLHLISNHVLNFSYDDFFRMQAAMEILKKALADSQVANEANGASSSSSEKEGPSLLLKDHVYNHLVAKYKVLFPWKQVVHWSKVDVTGWPQEVIYYRSACWEEEDVQRLFKAVEANEISFTKRSQAYVAIRLAKKLKMKAEVDEFFLRNFGIDKADWSLIKNVFPGFHLSFRDYRSWNCQDIKMIENLFEVYKSNLGKRKYSELESNEI